MKRVLRALGCGALMVIVAALLLAGWFAWRVQAGMPDLNETVSHPSLKAKVTVKRDDWGVPHIYADHETDAYFALGYCQAQDRLFQMEMMRRLAQGELAELLGPVVAPRIDAIARAFRLLPKAEEYSALYKEKYPEIYAMAEAYCAGINHFVEKGPLPVEFSILGIPRRTYTPADCMSVAAILPITFADGLREDGLQSMMKAKFPQLDTFPFFPGYLREPAPVTVLETLEEAQAWLRGERPTPPEASPEPGQAPGVPAEPVSETAPESAGLDQVSALAPLLDTLGILSQRLGWGMGSNSWVVSGSRSASGKPMLANDPHIAFFNPSIWYEAQLEYPGMSMYGYYLPLIPMTLIGHNERFGWALTMLANDDVDLFQETFNPENPNQVMYRGEWVDALVEEETIKVRFGRDVTAPIRVTPHGPIITDLLRLMSGYEGPDVSMSWVWQHQEYTDLRALYIMSKAQSMEEFEEGVALITSPGLNISYADVDGNIAWWAASRLPIRPLHVNEKALLDGASGKDEIVGYLPFEYNPRRINPEEGFIVTANNQSTVKPLGPNGEIPFMQGYFQPLDRAGRIEQMLAEKQVWTLEDMKRMQFDDLSYTGEEMRGLIVECIENSGVPLNAREKEAIEALRTWDLRHDLASVGATLYWTTCDFIVKNMAGDELGPKALVIYQTLADSFNAFKYFMRTPELEGWDNQATPEKETREQIVAVSFSQAVECLAREYGAEVKGWEWGKAHTMTFTHPLGYAPGFASIFNIGPFPSTGSDQVVNNMIYSASNGHFDVIAGPSTRRVVDFAQPEVSYSVLPTGNSGHVASKHYDDQAPLFMAGKYRELRFTREQVDKATENEMTFQP